MMDMKTPIRPRHVLFAAAIGAALLIWRLAGAGGAPVAAADGARPALASVVVAGAAGAENTGYDGVVQAVRQTTLAAQVSGSIVALNVKPGDRVQAGQVLMRLDARAADQTAAASAAQVLAARAAQETATRDFERQKQLFEKSYISQAALERAESQFKSAQAEAAAQLASAGAARTHTDFYVIRAPYAGVVAEVPVVLGDMAMPGRPLVTVYDPAALRVSAQVPQTVAARLAPDAAAMAEVPATPAGRIKPAKVQLLPTVDPATHTQELRLDLPAEVKGVTPGMFARAWLPMASGASARLFVSPQSVLRRAEMTAVYVIGADGMPLLRQVRLGRAEADRVEVLSGVAAGERVALDPQAAARIR
jgi:membrane fusion protein, multidrug efflux system